MGKNFGVHQVGGVEDGESIYSACERELTEETGYFGKAQKIVFLQDLTWENTGRNIEIFCTGRIDELKEPVNKYDHERNFFTEEEFKRIKFLPESINPFLIVKENKADYKTYL